MSVSYAFFGIVQLFATLIKAAVIVIIVLLVIKIAKGKPKTKNNQYGSQTYQPRNTKSFSWTNQSSKSIFSIFRRNKEVDCDLDERIFGPKNQHKDLF